MPPARPVSNNSAVRKFGQALSLTAALGGSAPAAQPQRTLSETEQMSAANELGNSLAVARGSGLGAAPTSDENYQPPAGTNFEATETSKPGEKQSLTKRLFGVTSAKANYSRSSRNDYQTPDRSKSTPTAEGTPESNTYDQLMAEQNRSRALIKAEQQSEKSDDTLRNQITSGNLLHIIKRVLPNFDSLLGGIEKAPAEKRLPLLEDLKSALRAAETGAGFIDGCSTWLEIFSLSIPTIVVPFLLPFLFLPWVILYMSFGRILGGTLSVGVHKITQIVDAMIAETKKQIAKKQKKRNLLLRLMQMQRRQSA